MLEIDITHIQGNFTLKLETQFISSATGVFGPSGCGKTTLFRLIAGLNKPARGRICLNGKPLVDVSESIFLPPHKRNIGVVFQDARLFPHLTVSKNLHYGRKRVRLAKLDPDEVIDLLQLRPLLKRYPIHLSGGETQRVALGRALLSEPELLLCDEPLSALDSEMKASILPFFELIRDQFNVTLVYVSHDMNEIARLTHEVLLLNEHKLKKKPVVKMNNISHPHALLKSI